MDARIAQRRTEVLRERRDRRRRRLGSLGVLLVVLAAVAGLVRSPLLAISEIRVLGAEGEQAVAVREATRIEVGDNIVAADVAAATDGVRGLAWVADAQVVRQPPATIQIRVRPREPFAVVRLEGESWTLDADGVVLGGGSAEGLVRVDARGAVLPRPGEQADDEGVIAALEFHRRLPADLAAAVRRYEAERPAVLRMEVEVGGEDPIWVRVGEAEQVERKAEALQAILPQARALVGPEGPGVVEVDVRVPHNPVLVPRTGPEGHGAESGEPP